MSCKLCCHRDMSPTHLTRTSQPPDCSRAAAQAWFAGERCQTRLCNMPSRASPVPAVTWVHHRQGITPHLKPCRTHSHFLILEFLPGCWFHHHARKPCVCSAKHQCQLFPGPLINLIICPLGSAEISAPILPCQACPSFAACWRRPSW